MLVGRNEPLCVLRCEVFGVKFFECSYHYAAALVRRRGSMLGAGRLRTAVTVPALDVFGSSNSVKQTVKIESSFEVKNDRQGRRKRTATPKVY